ncbi:hypothetical protein R3P38DRAFT_2758655 [Favolaschia claudopus]|uniref:Uncharacterized protein n=1 Tax=Favolaschia claudopus TaxID=2862362 RepID=A0AAW0EBJ8_9AGAR
MTVDDRLEWNHNVEFGLVCWDSGSKSKQLGSIPSALREICSKGKRGPSCAPRTRTQYDRPGLVVVDASMIDYVSRRTAGVRSSSPIRLDSYPSADRSDGNLDDSRRQAPRAVSSAYGKDSGTLGLRLGCYAGHESLHPSRHVHPRPSLPPPPPLWVSDHENGAILILATTDVELGVLDVFVGSPSPHLFDAFKPKHIPLGLGRLSCGDDERHGRLGPIGFDQEFTPAIRFTRVSKPGTLTAALICGTSTACEPYRVNAAGAASHSSIEFDVIQASRRRVGKWTTRVGMYAWRRAFGSMNGRLDAYAMLLSSPLRPSSRFRFHEQGVPYLIHAHLQIHLIADAAGYRNLRVAMRRREITGIWCQASSTRAVSTADGVLLEKEAAI